MFYREAGQFKTTYAADLAAFPLRQDRIGMFIWALLAVIVAVIGIPSAKWGEEVKACVVARPGMEIEAGDVIDYTRQKIAPFKCPKSIDVIPEMPRNASGKILRRQLRAPYWEGQERQVN